MSLPFDVQKNPVAGFPKVILDVVATEAVKTAEAHVQSGICFLALENSIIITDIT